jgi:hypothetical protein
MQDSTLRSVGEWWFRATRREVQAAVASVGGRRRLRLLAVLVALGLLTFRPARK